MEIMNKSVLFGVVNYQQRSPVFISDQDQLYITIALPVTLLCCLSLAGVIANIHNVLVFLGQSLKDNVSVALLSLSFTDFGVTLFSLALSLCHAWQVADPGSNIDQTAFLYLVFFVPYVMLGNISAGTTILVTFERCLCVILPLKIKAIITPKRMVFAIACVHTIIIAIYIPLYMSAKLIWVEDPSYSSNRTVLSLWLSSDRQFIENVYDYAVAIIMVTFSEICVISFSIVMVQGLKKARQFRKSAKTFVVDDPKKFEAVKLPEKQVLSMKELQLMRTVLSVAIVFVLCNSLMVLTGYAHVLVPGYNVGARYYNLHKTGSSLLFLALTLSSSVNIIVYYNTSSKYKEKLIQFYCHCCSLST